MSDEKLDRPEPEVENDPADVAEPVEVTFIPGGDADE